MSERLDGREQLAIRARSARAGDGLHQGLAQTETDREALLREVYRLDADRRADKAAIERVRQFAEYIKGWSADHDPEVSEHEIRMMRIAGAELLVHLALATPTPTEETDRG